MPLDLSKPPFMTERGGPMHFVGYTKDGRTVWEDDEHWISTRRADGRLHDGGPDGDDVINAPPPKVKETLWANIYPSGNGMFRGYIYSTLEAAKSRADFDAIDTVQIEVEYTPKRPLK